MMRMSLNVIPGRAKREPGIQTRALLLDSGFKRCALAPE
jgi:hypothetical protein